MTEKDKAEGSVRAVERALDILAAFSPADYELTAGELLKRVDLSRPTLYRLIYTLEQKGFLVSSGEPQRFRLGPAAARLAHVWTSAFDIVALAMPAMRQLWSETQETVALFLAEGEVRICVAELASSQALSFKRGVGYREKLGVGASGRAVLAFTDVSPAQVKAHARTAGKDAKAYADELAETRRRGYAISRDELITGAVAIAVPLWAPDQTVLGSLAVFGPGARLNPQRIQEIAAALQLGSSAISQAMGGSRSDSPDR